MIGGPCWYEEKGQGLKNRHLAAEPVSMGFTAIFVDGGYLAKILNLNYNGVQVNFESLAKVMSQPHELLRAYFYHCRPSHLRPLGEEGIRSQRVGALLTGLAHFAKRGKLTNAAALSDDSAIIPFIEIVKCEGIHTTLWCGGVTGELRPNQNLLRVVDDCRTLTADIIMDLSKTALQTEHSHQKLR